MAGNICVDNAAVLRRIAEQKELDHITVDALSTIATALCGLEAREFSNPVVAQIMSDFSIRAESLSRRFG